MIINDSISESIATDLSASEIYPHTGGLFHYLMGFTSVLIIIPLSLILMPLLVTLKLLLYGCCYPLLNKYADLDIPKEIDSLKNRALLFFHYIIFKLFYIYLAIWVACFYKFDGYWYGIDISRYRNYDDYMSSYRDSRVRWRYKKKLRTFKSLNIQEHVLPDSLVFSKILFSPGIFKLIKQSNFRKNRQFSFLNGLMLIMRDYYMLLFLPMRVHTFEKDGRIVALSTYLKRGNTVIMCQHIIADDFVRSGLFYKQMDNCISYAFNDPAVRYISCSVTSRQAKETSGCHPINFLLTDEFRYLPFSSFDRPNVHAPDEEEDDISEKLLQTS